MLTFFRKSISSNMESSLIGNLPYAKKIVAELKKKGHDHLLKTLKNENIIGSTLWLFYIQICDSDIDLTIKIVQAMEKEKIYGKDINKAIETRNETPLYQKLVGGRSKKVMGVVNELILNEYKFFLCTLFSEEITESTLWSLYQDICASDIDQTIDIIEALRSKIIKGKDVKDAITTGRHNTLYETLVRENVCRDKDIVAELIQVGGKELSKTLWLKYLTGLRLWSLYKNICEENVKETVRVVQALKIKEVNNTKIANAIHKSNRLFFKSL